MSGGGPSRTTPAQGKGEGWTKGACVYELWVERQQGGCTKGYREEERKRRAGRDLFRMIVSKTGWVAGKGRVCG